MKRGSSTLQVYLSECESQEWGSDAAFRNDLLRRLEGAANERGRRYVQVFSAEHAELAMREVRRG